MNIWNVKEIEKILEASGKIAVSFYDNPGYELKNDKSIVTDADKAVEAYLNSIFNKPENGSYMIGEETISQYDEKYINSALSETAWIIDPIDGTAPYAHHIPTWGISIALSKNGKLQEGAIFLPVIGEMFITENNNIYYKKRIIEESKAYFTELQLLKNNSSNKNISLISITQEITKYNTLSIYNPVQSICSAVFSMTQLLQKRYLGYILSRHIKIWDFAAGFLMLQKAGFATDFRDGTHLPLEVRKLCDLNKPDNERWKLKNEAVFAIDENSFSYIVKNIAF